MGLRTTLETLEYSNPGRVCRYSIHECLRWDQLNEWEQLCRTLPVPVDRTSRVYLASDFGVDRFSSNGSG
jgi:hypothetical protein